VCSVLVSRASEAQSLVPLAAWGTSPSVSVWHFATPLAQSAGGVGDVAEAAVPFRVRVARKSWRADLTGAAAFGAVHLTSPSGDDRAITIAGPTDVKLRVTAPLLSDATLLTVGVNIPTGKVALSSDETTALQILAAPALAMPVASFGTGSGFTVGLVRAFQGEGWAVALGAAAEKRSEYSPVSLALSSGTSSTQLTPGMAAHVTAGLDRTVGRGRVGVLVVGDVYTKDQIVITTAPRDTSNNYTLGPQLSVSTQYDFGGGGWRESAIGAGVRLRTMYADATGAKVTGSSGTYLEGSLSGVRGGAEGAGLIIGADARYHTGLLFTEALVGAAVSAVGLTLGFEHAGQRTATRLTVHGSYGTFATGKSSATGMGVTLGFSIAARREAQ
jgi:hypothetical protein